MNPTNTTIDKLEQILTELFRKGTTLSHASNTSVSEAKQAIIAWALEAVGSDEQLDEVLKKKTARDYFISGRNSMRQEIRAKLTGGKP